jgi:shikimate kinase
MMKNFKHSLAVTIISCFITVIGHAQSADTLKAATIQEKSETITFRMEKELALTKEQSTHVLNALIERFQDLEK